MIKSLKNFILIGAAGYIAPVHMEAIKATGNTLLAALDTHDSVGVLDNYFPNADFFTEFERFDRHCEKLRRSGTPIHYLSVCSPNYLHDAHIRFGLRLGADVICEKPVVLNPWNVDALAEMEKETGKKVFTILQLRHHPAITALRKKVEAAGSSHRFQINLEYITPRGNWYFTSWKGNPDKSGGITTNIGLHFFDMLLWIFGNVQKNIVKEHLPSRASGMLELEKADVNWKLSIEASQMPGGSRGDKKSFRSLSIDGEKVEFSEGFNDLHNQAYHEILAGNGFGLQETRPGIQLVHDIRNFKQA